jgi:hypothetical protein
MKKMLLILVAVIGFGTITNAQEEQCTLSSCGLSAACNDYPKILTYSEAVSNCPVGYRLPTIEELLCMAKNKSSLNIRFGEYWSGTDSKGDKIFTVTMDDKKREECDKSEKKRVRYIKDSNYVPSENSELQVSQNWQLTDKQSAENYSLVHIYRLPNFFGCAFSCDIDLEDGSVWKCKNGRRQTIKVTKETPFTLHAKTETDVNLTFDVEFSKEDYVKCIVVPGAVVWRPIFILRDESEGLSEFNEIKAKNDDTK